MNRFILIIALVIVTSNYVFSEKTIEAIKLNNSEILLDGILNEEVWKKAPRISDFTLKDPVEGGVPSLQNFVSFAYDNKYLYFAADLKRNQNHEIRAGVSRRDNAGNSERIIISLDPLNSKRNAYSFLITAKNVRSEYYHTDDSEYSREYEFNPVWQVKAKINDDGWSAEAKIPFSQLRFNEKSIKECGLNINIYVPSTREDIYWIVVPKHSIGWASKFGKLKGLDSIQSSNRIEILPFSAINVLSNPFLTNPLYEETEFSLKYGVDAKIGLSSNFTLDATILPDFGQVEADPAEVNLSTYETQFAEKRPFFIEGNDLFSNLNKAFYYSRRIGSQPKGTAIGEHVRFPLSSEILAASKLSGRTENGLTLALMSALTKNEYAEVSNSGEESKVLVEPSTSFNALRLMKQIDSNSSYFGAILTGVFRQKSNIDLESRLNNNAITGAFDFLLRFNKGDYEIEGLIGGSSINGTKEAILLKQLASQRYYQRPDADYLEIDSNMTNLSGLTGYLSFRKNYGAWLYSGMLEFSTPGFEINDLGLLRKADEIFSAGELVYRDTKPGDFFYSWKLSLQVQNMQNFAGDFIDGVIRLSSFSQFLDFSNLTLNLKYFPVSSDNQKTRGGPLVKIGERMEVYSAYETDWSKNNVVMAEIIYDKYMEDANFLFLNARLTSRQFSPFEFKIESYYSHRIEPRQYITSQVNAESATYGKRYILSHFEQNTSAIRLWISYAFTPEFTLEFYAEPFVSQGRFYNFGELVSSKEIDLKVYGKAANTTISKEASDKYKVQDGNKSFEISNYDFNVSSLRSSLVLRWEWTRGSTMYLVWQQNKSMEKDVYGELSAKAISDLIKSDGINAITFKINYWLPID